MKIVLHRVGLFFAARIGELARASGAEVESALDQDLVAAVKRTGAALVLVELERADFGQIRAVKREFASTLVVGFGPHVREDLADSAREAGCDDVLAKGEMGTRLARMLAQLR